MLSVQTHDVVGPCSQEFRVYNEHFYFGRQSIVPTYCAPQAAVIKAALWHSHLLTRSQHSHSSAIYISYFSSWVVRFTRCWGSCLGHSVCLLSADLELLLLGFGGKFCVKVARKSALSYWHVVLVIFSSSSEAGWEDKPLNSPALLLGGPCLAINTYQSGAGTFCDCSSGACQTPEAWKPGKPFTQNVPVPNPSALMHWCFSFMP